MKNTPLTLHDLEYVGIPNKFSDAISNLEILWDEFSSKIMHSMKVRVKEKGTRDFEFDAQDALREFVDYGERIDTQFGDQLSMDDRLEFLCFIRSEWGKIEWMKRWKNFMFNGGERRFFEKFKWIKFDEENIENHIFGKIILSILESDENKKIKPKK